MDIDPGMVLVFIVLFLVGQVAWYCWGRFLLWLTDDAR